MTALVSLAASFAAVSIPLAHAGHVLADAAIFGVPVGSVVLTIWALNRWGPKDE